MKCVGGVVEGNVGCGGLVVGGRICWCGGRGYDVLVAWWGLRCVGRVIGAMGHCIRC